MSSACRLHNFVMAPLSLSLVLRPTVSRPVWHPSQAYDQIFITVRQLRFCWYGALSLTRGQVCGLQLLLTLASAVILGSESRGARDHILLSQIWDIPFCGLLRLVGLRWRYSTQPLCQSQSQSESYVTIDGQSARLSWYKAPMWGLRQDFIYVRYSQACWCGALTLTRGRVCRLPESQGMICCTEPRLTEVPHMSAHLTKSKSILYYDRRSEGQSALE
jgi:hypothetical protein